MFALAGGKRKREINLSLFGCWIASSRWALSSGGSPPLLDVFAPLPPDSRTKKMMLQRKSTFKYVYVLQISGKKERGSGKKGGDGFILGRILSTHSWLVRNETKRRWNRNERKSLFVDVRSMIFSLF